MPEEPTPYSALFTEHFPTRPLAPGMGEAVARRTVFNPQRNETWADVATRVAVGNAMLHPGTSEDEVRALRDHIAMGRVLMSGRHLQHGDTSQPERPMEVYTNCATASTTWSLFLLLLSGSGVGRCYDDELMLVDWKNAPHVVPVLDAEHPDRREGYYFDAPSQERKRFLTPAEAWELYPNAQWHTVGDSREGWAKALERVEYLAFTGLHGGTTLVLDFSKVRPRGAPIVGMQGRPASGPVPCMQAFMEALSVKWYRYERWEQAIRVDHAFAACVVVGGARRSARMSWKWWGDPGIHTFINLKEQGKLWSSNNSVGVDAEFWTFAGVAGTPENAVFEAVCNASYQHGTGEPGWLNLDRLHQNCIGLEANLDGLYIGSNRYQPEPATATMMARLAEVANQMQYPYGTNPCGEVPLHVLGGFCVIGDVVPFHCDSLDQAIDAAVLTARALIRVNSMNSLYQREVERTNRIGVSLTGLHEAAWHHFRLTFRDLVDEQRSQPFWDFLERMRVEVEAASRQYAMELGLAIPHTFCTIKPAGTTSKLFGLSEGAHLPAMAFYLRWVQFQHGDPLIEVYEQKGYPVVHVVPGYKDVSIVGFPTAPTISSLGIPADQLVTAADATPEEQYQWVRLLEQYWLGANGHQVSYTLKFDRSRVSYEQFRATVLTHQPTVRCVAVMPADDWRVTRDKYGYVPEQPIGSDEYTDLINHLQGTAETVNLEDLQCSTGGCPL